MGTKDNPTDESGGEQSCRFKICKDPETGKVVIIPEGNCPAGFVEELADESLSKGQVWQIPKVNKEYDDPEYQEFLEWKKWKEQKQRDRKRVSVKVRNEND